MSLANALPEAPEGPVKGPRSQVVQLLDSLADDADGYARVIEMLDDPAWSAAELSRVLTEHTGMKVGFDAIRRWRDGTGLRHEHG